MPDTEETRDAARPVPDLVRKRARRHRRRPLVVRYWWVIPIALGVAAIPVVWTLFTARATHDPLAGYVTDEAKIEEEYLTFSGKTLDAAVAAQFDRATELMRSGNYANAAIVMEAASKDIPVPAVFNNLGVLYARLKDGAHAVRAFRDALARDHDYALVRVNAKKLNVTETMEPSASELEPNNDNTQANALWLERPLQASITPSLGDVDCFWFITPRPPRDRISVSAISQSASLIPRLRIYDQKGNLVTGLKEAAGAGGAVRFDFSPPPNGLYYLQIDGVSGSGGNYAVTVSALHAYDVYEPNDTILTATHIAPGQNVGANIMDGDDTDFYSFSSPVTGSVTIDVVSHSGDLQLGLGTFGSDLHNMGFAPDLKNPGDSIQHELRVEANQMYYLQVFSKNDTKGPYELVVK
jgi:hypothetical protein